MVIALAALFVNAAMSPASPQLPPDQLQDIFVAACLDGQARLAEGEASAVAFADLPSALRQRLGRPSSGNVWQLNAPGRAYLYVLNYEPGPGTSPTICGLASDRMPLGAAADTLELRVAGRVYEKSNRTTQWMRPQDGYVATATTAAEFNVVQLNWLSEADRAEAIKELRREGTPLPMPKAR